MYCQWSIHHITWWFIIIRTFFCTFIAMIINVISMHKFAFLCSDNTTHNLLKWLSVCDLYLVITASTRRNFSERQCTGSSGSWNSRVTESWETRLYSTQNWVTEQPGLEYSGLYSVVCDVRKCLPTSNQRCREVVWEHCVCMGRTWPASDWHGSQAVANSSSHLHQG